MKIKVWGCRGSLPTPGGATSRYGGNTTCIEIRSASGQILVIDAGSGVRNLGQDLRQRGETGPIRFFFTHAHMDHLIGFPFFLPAYLKEYTIVLCGGPHAEGTLGNYLAHQMEAPFFPVALSALKAQIVFRCDRSDTIPGTCCLRDIDVIPVPLNHPQGGYGYKFRENHKTFVFLTDNELAQAHPGGPDRSHFVDFCRDADVLFHDAQYNDDEYQSTRGWGHSTYHDAVSLALDAGVRRLGLFHHDPDRTDDDLDHEVEVCRAHLRNAGSALECFAAADGMQLRI